MSWGGPKQDMFFCSPEELINFVHPLLAACREDEVVVSLSIDNIPSPYLWFETD